MTPFNSSLIIPFPELIAAFQLTSIDPCVVHATSEYSIWCIYKYSSPTASGHSIEAKVVQVTGYSDSGLIVVAADSYTGPA